MILINDFNYTLKKPLFHFESKSYIKSVQIDHLLISRSGIFIIETKNWSENSISNLDLFSPVQQVLRANFALYKILEKESNKISFKKQHWGKRKILIKNLIVFINNKPKEEFYHVKILSLNDLIGYIRHFPLNLTYEETQSLGKFFLEISDN